ncbi:helix-turn-helix transcriptional regulator [Haloechinothrix sp. YIM 98757]|uniref:Helix-turn-helix transcriptional regulator n=1 Tax=Haloechinothrix aidingensis TaxID=2752311 RepID=A0A838A921_9PSEU|nr:helix-turn-helix transcriptional regulator [Haloechinothrix aidingensis]MBA0125081.1 helix-turn-helix transcriptional regulator [Haloechinothrix aidingensis]
MPSNTRTPKARALGSALREARESREISLRGLAVQLGKDPGMLSRWETGERIPKPTDVAQILTLLGVNGDQYDEIVEMTSGTDASQWLAVSLPEQRQQLAALLDLESTATAITDVSPLLVPGILQVSSYVRAIMTAGGVPADEVATRVAVRIGRRDAITRADPARVLALIGEAALRQIIGNRAIMVEQLNYLREMAELPNVDVRVIPLASGWHPGLEGPFTLIDTSESSVVQIENRRSGLFLHEDEDVDIYRQGVDTVLQVAMSPEGSRGLITEVANEMETTS